MHPRKPNNVVNAVVQRIVQGTYFEMARQINGEIKKERLNSAA